MKRTHANCGREGKDGEAGLLILRGRQTRGGLAVGTPDREGLRGATGPQLALILKVVRHHLRKWGVQSVKFIHLRRVVH